MHVWKDLPQHKSTADSMIYWLETVTAVGVYRGTTLAFAAYVTLNEPTCGADH